MHNFGKNVVYEPRHRYTPRTEEEVLAILARHRGGQIRVQGSGHSWSGIVEATDVLVSLSHFSGVTVEEGPVGHVARVGAGATIEKILAGLRKTAFSLPTLGAMTRQTIAGAAATATHGTGSASLSSFVRTVRLACYDAGGNPIIRTIRGGDELLAARVSLGCLGVILELTLELVPRFWMHECMKGTTPSSPSSPRKPSGPSSSFWSFHTGGGGTPTTADGCPSRTHARSGACGGSGRMTCSWSSGGCTRSSRQCWERPGSSAPAPSRGFGNRRCHR